MTNLFKLAINHSEIFLNAGLSPPSRTLLYGPPGCGKTHITSVIASRFNLPIISVKRSNVLGKYFGESEKNLADIFHKVRFYDFKN